MIDNFIFSANAVFPIFLVITFGYFLRRTDFLSSGTVTEMNRLVFTFALPLLLFRNIYQADFGMLFDPGFIFWLVGSIVIVFVLIWGFAEVFLRKRKDLIGAFVQASIRANYAIVGLPLVSNIMGEYDTGLAALAAAFVVTSFNVLSVIVLVARGSQSGKFDLAFVKNIVLSVCKNPSIIAIAIAVAVNLLNIPVPVIAQAGINYIAVLCTPMALLAVGGSIQLSAMMGYVRPALAASAIRIIVVPLLMVSSSALMGFRGEPLAVIFAVSANPTAIVSYVMAARMNGNTEVTAAIILTTTAFSSVTLTVGVYILRTLALI